MGANRIAAVEFNSASTTTSTALVTLSLTPKDRDEKDISKKSSYDPLAILLDALPSFSADLLEIVIKFCDSYLHTLINPSSLTPMTQKLLLLNTSSAANEYKELCDAFTRAVFSVEQDSKLNYVAVTMIENHPHLAFLEMNVALQDGRIVKMPALIKAFYSLDSRFRIALAEAMHNTGFTDEDIKKLFQQHFDEASVGNRPLYIDTIRWGKTYEDTIRLANQNRKKANQTVVEVLGKVHEDMITSAPNFLHQLCADRPMRSEYKEYSPPYDALANLEKELANKHFKRNTIVAVGKNYEDLYLKPNSGLGSRVFIERGYIEWSHGDISLNNRARAVNCISSEWAIMSLKSDLRIINAYAAQEILRASEYLKRTFALEPSERIRCGFGS